MPGNLPFYISAVFLLSVIATFLFLLFAVKNKMATAILLMAWLAITGLLAWKDFFADTEGMPPKFTLAVVPAVVFIIILLVSKKSKSFIDGISIKALTILHIVRVPVELVLYWLAAEKWVPDLMTFEGRNFDIISGITAPVIFFVCFKDQSVKNKNLLLAWNFICLALLLNIVIHAALSAPFSFQKFAFSQPNIAVLHFPFIWLPSFIVMVVLFSHLVVIKKLLKK